MELEKTGFSLEERILCSDDACIGVVGPDGLCKECKRPYEGDEPLPTGKVPGPADASGPPAAPVPGSGSGAVRAPAPADWDPSERVPCHDDACIGIIGEDGRCGTCGRGA